MTFEKNDTYNKVISIITEELKIEKEAITNHTTFQDLGADSLDMVQIVMKLEEQFGIQISDDEAEKLQTLADVVEYINQKRSK